MPALATGAPMAIFRMERGGGLGYLGRDRWTYQDKRPRGGMKFLYRSRFRESLAALRRESRYRVFADIVRRRGAYPQASLYTNQQSHPVTVWCSNDYLGMSQHPKVIAAMREAVEQAGAGSGGTRNIS